MQPGDSVEKTGEEEREGERGKGVSGGRRDGSDGLSEETDLNSSLKCP